MKRVYIKQVAALVPAAVFTGLTGMPVAYVPIKVSENTAALVPVFAVLALILAWISLAVSKRRRRDLFAAFALNLLTVFFLCQALNDLGMCYSYYVTG